MKKVLVFTTIIGAVLIVGLFVMETNLEDKFSPTTNNYSIPETSLDLTVNQLIKNLTDSKNIEHFDQKNIVVRGYVGLRITVPNQGIKVEINNSPNKNSIKKSIYCNIEIDIYDKEEVAQIYDRIPKGSPIKVSGVLNTGGASFSTSIETCKIEN